MNMCDESYEIKTATSRHLSDVLRIMRENFYHDETMFKSLCLNYNDIDNKERQRIDEFFDGSIKAAFENSPCIIVIHKETSEVVGALITTLSENSKITGSSEETKDGLATIFSTNNAIPPSVRTYIDYLTRMNDEANLFNRFPNARIIWEFYAVAVDKNHRKLGLAKNLMKAGLDLAVKKNVSMIFGVFTSIYSKLSAEKVGMKSLIEFDLAQYEDTSGAQIFKHTKPHNIVSVMVLQL